MASTPSYARNATFESNMTPVPWPETAMDHAARGDRFPSPQRPAPTSPIVAAPFTPGSKRAQATFGWGAALCNNHPAVSPYVRRRWELKTEEREREMQKALSRGEREVLTRRREELALKEGEMLFGDEELDKRNEQAVKIQAGVRGMLARKKTKKRRNVGKQLVHAVVGVASIPVRIVGSTLGLPFVLFRRR